MNKVPTVTAIEYYEAANREAAKAIRCGRSPRGVNVAAFHRERAAEYRRQGAALAGKEKAPAR